MTKYNSYALTLSGLIIFFNASKVDIEAISTVVLILGFYFVLLSLEGLRNEKIKKEE